MYSDSAGSYLKEVALSALNCYAHDEDSQSNLRHSGGKVLYVMS